MGEFRAEKTAESYIEDGVVYCLFNFAPEQTAELKSGSVVRLEIYDTESKNSMYFNDEFAVVRATSLNS